MKKYYFTYGTSEDFPYKGGWTVVIAESMKDAIALFDLVHPRRSDFVNCSSMYNEAQFSKTEMCKNNDNFGAGCHEVIELTVNKTVS